MLCRAAQFIRSVRQISRRKETTMAAAATLLEDCCEPTEQLEKGVDLDVKQNHKANINNDVLEEIKPTVVRKVIQIKLMQMKILMKKQIQQIMFLLVELRDLFEKCQLQQ